MPEIAYKAPEVLDSYSKFEIDGITVYIAKSATLGTEEIRFVLKSFLFMKEIVPYGLKMPGI